MNERAETHTLLELWDEVGTLVTGVVVVAPILPGFLLCVPGLLLFALPFVVAGMAAGLLVLVGWVIAMPYLLVRFLLRRSRSRIVLRQPTALVTMPTSLPSKLDVPHEYAFDA